MELNGLPLHPLIVHVVVVLLPLTAVAAVLVSLWPAAQRKLTFLVPLGALVVLASVPVAIKAGESLAATQFGSAQPEFQQRISSHGELGEGVLVWAIALFVLTAAQYAYLRFARPRRVLTVVLAVLVIVAAVGGVVQVALAGDAGAQLVWGGTS